MAGLILEEEWEHHRYAVRDLDAIEAKYDGVDQVGQLEGSGEQGLERA